MKRAISDTAAEIRSEASTALVIARDRLRDLAGEMAEAVGRSRPDTSEIAVDLLSLPSISVPAAVEEWTMKRRAWAFGTKPRSIARKIATGIGSSLDSAYASFGNALLRAGERALSALAERFAAQSEPLRAQARRAASPPAGLDRSRLEEDLRKLGWTAA